MSEQEQVDKPITLSELVEEVQGNFNIIQEALNAMANSTQVLINSLNVGVNQIKTLTAEVEELKAKDNKKATSKKKG